MDYAYPKISVITPSYNQGNFLEHTIKSVIEQNYPNLEYIIIDGGSTDNSVDIMKKYEHNIDYWISEKDNGQTDAIMKGFQKATGQYLAWLNSDDTYLQNCLLNVGDILAKNPDIDIIYGDYVITDVSGNTLLKKKEIPFDYNILLHGVNFIGQPTTFFSRDILERSGGLKTDLDYYMDWEFWLRAANHGAKFKHIKKYLATYRYHAVSKTVKDHLVNIKCINEADEIHKIFLEKGIIYNKKLLNIIYRFKRQLTKLFYRGTVDIIPGLVFVWFYKKYKIKKDFINEFK